MNSDFNILQDIWSINLALLGITLTIFTVLYSFILVKRDELRITAVKIKSGDESIDTKLSNQNLSNYIRNLKSINSKIVSLIVICFVVFVLSWIADRILPDEFEKIKMVFSIVLGILTFGEIIYLSFNFFNIVKHYNSTTKI